MSGRQPRRYFRVALASASVLLAVAGVAHLMYPFTSLVRGEAVFQGKPTSFWSAQAKRWTAPGSAGSPAATTWQDQIWYGVGLRSRASLTAADLGDAAAVPVLVQLLQDGDCHVQQVAAYLLGEVGWPARQAEPELSDFLRAQDKRLRLIAGDSLFRVKGHASDALPAMREALRHRDAGVRWRAAYIIWLWGSRAKECVPALGVCTRDENQTVRTMAVIALRDVAFSLQEEERPATKQAIAALLAAIKQEPSLGLRAIMNCALCRLKHEPSIESGTPEEGIEVPALRARRRLMPAQSGEQDGPLELELQILPGAVLKRNSQRKAGGRGLV
jgi:hypothetical protein